MPGRRRWETRSRNPASSTASDARKPMAERRNRIRRSARTVLADLVAPLRTARPPQVPPNTHFPSDARPAWKNEISTKQTPPARTQSRKAAARRPPRKGTHDAATSVTQHHTQTRSAHDTVGHESAGPDAFSTDIAGLPGTVPTPSVQLFDGAVYDLRVAPVTK